MQIIHIYKNQRKKTPPDRAAINQNFVYSGLLELAPGSPYP